MAKALFVTATALAALTAACAATGDDMNAAQTSAASVAQAAPQTQQPTTFTDAQLRSYVAAREEIEPLQANFASQTPEQQRATTAEITAVIERHGLTPVQFNAVARMANTDQAFASRLAAAQPDTFSDETLRAFTAASAEIDPISRSLATQTPEQQAQSAEQIRQILTRHNLDGATYNAIAARAQADTAFAARLITFSETNGD
ncbi:MAG: DUF4168 domain-containing protein [Hyphomonadaceae bacterium]